MAPPQRITSSTTPKVLIAIPRISAPIFRHAVTAQDVLDESEVHELAELARINRAYLPEQRVQRRRISPTSCIPAMDPAIRAR